MPIEWEHTIVEFLTELFQTIGWGGVVGIMALESAHLPIPIEVTMPISGWLLVQARGGSASLAVWLGGLWGAVGCTLGSWVSYALGALGGGKTPFRSLWQVSDDQFTRSRYGRPLVQPMG